MWFGITYVGISRVRALKNILIDDFDESRFEHTAVIQSKLNKLIDEENRLFNMYIHDT